MANDIAINSMNNFEMKTTKHNSIFEGFARIHPDSLFVELSTFLVVIFQVDGASIFLNEGACLALKIRVVHYFHWTWHLIGYAIRHCCGSMLN